MTRDDIIRMAKEVADISTDSRGREEFIFDSYGVERFAALVAAAEREKVAHWMQTACYATGHGGTTEDLLRELAWQADERIAKAVAAEREECAKVCEAEGKRVDASWVSCASAIRERGAP
jgi:protein-disulfide isomerase-like protein with CxxC motif